VVEPSQHRGDLGVEDRALVMELVEGVEPKGPMPFDEAWKIASQIAAALE